MKTKILIFGYKEFSQLMNSVLDQFTSVASFKLVDAILVSVNEVAQHVTEFEPDVVVSAGSNASYLQSVLDIPVVSTPNTSRDLIAAVTRASKVSNDIVVISFQQNKELLGLLSHSLNVTINEHNYATSDQARELFLIHASPKRAFVGASYVCGLASVNNCPAFLTYSADACVQAIEKALHVAQEFTNKRDELAILSWLEKHSQLAVVLYSASDDRVVFNQAAKYEIGINVQQSADIQTLKEATKQSCPVNGKIILAEQHWWYHLEKVTSTNKSYFVFQFFPKPQRTQSNYTSKKHTLVFKSEAMTRLLEQLKSYALSPSNILIQGESGTGKELIAREIYQNSTFNKGNFVALNCSAIPSELFESELFGHRDGAFTGSRKGGRKGLVEEASDGVLFLDEISELAMDQQAKLLRFLQERTYRPLGANEETPVNLKLVAASNKPLKELVKKGEFREDLYYRLNVFNLFVPPLRLRKPDITKIARYKLQGFLDNYSVNLSADDVLRVLNGQLVRYEWPGNIRELENILERLVATLAVDTNLSKLNQKLESIAPELFTEPLSSIEDGLVRSKELELVVDAMNKFSGNKTKVAKYLGMSQTTLWRRLKRINE